MVVELSAQPPQNIAMETRCRHSVVQAQRYVSTGKAQCSASDTETRLALRRGSTLNGAGPFSCPERVWPGEELWEWASSHSLNTETLSPYTVGERRDRIFDLFRFEMGCMSFLLKTHCYSRRKSEGYFSSILRPVRSPPDRRELPSTHRGLGSRGFARYRGTAAGLACCAEI